jgi:hypothetical protein
MSSKRLNLYMDLTFFLYHPIFPSEYFLSLVSQRNGTVNPRKERDCVLTFNIWRVSLRNEVRMLNVKTRPLLFLTP